MAARKSASKRAGPSLVQAVAGKLRERVFASAPDARLGGLGDLAAELGVGVVTVQQAARVLEHEGLLAVRRGPNGGYYGRRPDEATLERSLAAYLRMRPHSIEEALDITSLLFIELVGAAAGCADEGRHAELDRFAQRLAACTDLATMGDLEGELQELLFRMVDRPLFELLTRMTFSLAGAVNKPAIYRDEAGVLRWRDGRARIVGAILVRDEALARFEADRSNRQVILEWLRSAGRHQADSPVQAG